MQTNRELGLLDTLQAECFPKKYGAQFFVANGSKSVKFVFANGAAPAKLSIPGEELLIDSTAFLELEELPKEILFVGGGYIAFEFAHIVARFGVNAEHIGRNMAILNFFMIAL